MSFVPLNIIVRTPFRSIILSFLLWYLIQILNSTQPHGLPIFVLIYTQFILIPLFIADILCFLLRSHVCKIFGLYHVLMYVCRLQRFVVPQFFGLSRLPTYADLHVFFVLRSYVCKILCLNHVPMYVCRLYWFLLPMIFMLVLNSDVCRILRFFACTKFLCKKVKHFMGGGFLL